MAAAVAWESRHGFAAEYAAARAEIETRAEVKRLFGRVRDRWDQNDPATRAWLDTIARNNLAFVRVYPATFWEALEDLRQAPICDAVSGSRPWTPARPQSIEIAIRFLEADLICFRSGYVKERLIRRLVRQRLGDEDEARLRAVVLKVLDRRGGRDFRVFCRLAARVADKDLDDAVSARLASEDTDLHRRAGWMRDAIAVEAKASP